MSVKMYAVINTKEEKYYNNIAIDEDIISEYVYWEDSEAILIPTENLDEKYRSMPFEYMKDAVPEPEDPLAPLSNLTLEQKQQIAAILGLGSDNTPS